mmetsp:Transcript_38354/g.34178  ORF Transcript_38354/g.34178 Transcript_38354/m.34178 type:complete len:107 (+) Transcript_38354:123-443(+)
MAFVGNLLFVAVFAKIYVQFTRIKLRKKLLKKKKNFVMKKRFIAKLIWGSEDVKNFEEKLKEDPDYNENSLCNDSRDLDGPEIPAMEKCDDEIIVIKDIESGSSNG